MSDLNAGLVMEMEGVSWPLSPGDGSVRRQLREWSKSSSKSCQFGQVKCVPVWVSSLSLF